jgi:hypothetical protein
MNEALSRCVAPAAPRHPTVEHVVVGAASKGAGTELWLRLCPAPRLSDLESCADAGSLSAASPGSGRRGPFYTGQCLIFCRPLRRPTGFWRLRPVGPQRALLQRAMPGFLQEAAPPAERDLAASPVRAAKGPPTAGNGGFSVGGRSDGRTASSILAPEFLPNGGCAHAYPPCVIEKSTLLKPDI